MLKPFELTDMELLQSWVTDADILFRFSGRGFSYPLTLVQIQEYIAQHPERHFYMGYTADGIPFSFGEIIPQEGNVPRLGRLLIGDPGLRGKGLGNYFVKLLVRECQRLYNARFVELYVWENNAAAIKCYKSVGFEFVAIDPFCLVYNGIDHNILKMRLTIEK